MLISDNTKGIRNCIKLNNCKIYLRFRSFNPSKLLISRYDNAIHHQLSSEIITFIQDHGNRFIFPTHRMFAFGFFSSDRWGHDKRAYRTNVII